MLQLCPFIMLPPAASPVAPSIATQEEFLPVAAPWLGDEEKNEVLRVLESDWLTTGPVTQRFEVEFAAFTGAAHCLAVNSCTAALHLALAALDVGAGDAVVTTPFTFCATANVIVHQGAQPCFVDIAPDTCNLDPDKLEEFLTRRCRWNATRRFLTITSTGARLRAIIAVHYGGHPCDMARIAQLARRFGLRLIEDVAHAPGATFAGRMAGTFGDFGCFSFYATKNLATGEGGMLITGDAELARRARVLCLHGISRDAWRRYAEDGSWRYDVEDAGFKYNLSDVVSAIGIHQLRKLEAFNRRRAELAALYQQRLAALPLQLPQVRKDATSAWHLYPVRLRHEGISRDDLVSGLQRRRIGASVHFIPLHLTRYYQRAFGFRAGDFPVAEAVFERIVSLPMFPRMRDEDTHRVAGALRDILTG